MQAIILPNSKAHSFRRTGSCKRPAVDANVPVLHYCIMLILVFLCPDPHKQTALSGCEMLRARRVCFHNDVRGMKSRAIKCCPHGPARSVPGTEPRLMPLCPFFVLSGSKRVSSPGGHVSNPGLTLRNRMKLPAQSQALYCALRARASSRV